MTNLNRSLLIKELENIPDVFNDVSFLKRHLAVMKHNPALEWFNIALIAFDQTAAQKGFQLALSEEDWRQYGISFPLTGRGIPLLFPFIEGRKMIWQIRHFYTVGDFGLDEPANERSIPSIFGVYESSGKMALINNTFPKEWQSNLIDEYLSIHEVPQAMSKSFLKACLTVTWGANLYLKANVSRSDLVLPVTEQESWEVYKFLSDIVTGFPRFVMLWIEKQQINQSNHSQGSDLASLTVRLMNGVSR